MADHAGMEYKGRMNHMGKEINDGYDSKKVNATATASVSRSHPKCSNWIRKNHLSSCRPQGGC